MSRSRLASLAFVLPLLATAACAGTASEDTTGASSQDVNASWLASNIPPGSALEGKVLALVNDRTMTEALFASECSYTPAQAAAILAYRTGDDTIAATDDQRFDSLSELDAVPFTDMPFWANTVRCAMLHTPGPGVCVGGPPVVIELVVDESGSMNGDKWAATRDSILALYAKLHTAANPSVLVGTATFDDNVNWKVRPKAMTDDQLDELKSRIDKPAPHGGGTGLEKALTAAFDVVEHTPGAAVPGARRIVVLLSDGSPSGGDTEKQRCIDLTTDAHARGIELFAVGIGEFPSSNPGMYDPALMGKLAQNGGTAPAGCDPLATDLASICHVQITPSAGAAQLETDLTSALDAIQAASIPSTCP